MLVGRDWECGEIDRILSRAAEGTGAVRVLRGEPGVGKSALVRWTAEHANDATVVLVRCVEQDRHQAFTTLRTIVSRLAPALPDLLPEQAAALHAMLGDGPPVGQDAIEIGAALVALLSAASRTQSLVVLIDDGHWIDVSSGEALLFAARRVEHEPVVILVGAREVEWDRLGSDLPVLPLRGLAPLDAAALLGDRVDLPVAEALAAQTDGNPLAMLEIAEQLSPDERRGTVALAPVGSLSDVLMHGFLARTASLSEAQRTVLLFVAADPRLDLDLLVAAAKLSGFADDVVDSVVSPGLLSVAGRSGLEIVHPLLRTAIYQSATAAQRRHVHALLADVLAGTVHVERYAWHLAAAATGADEQAALALDAAARVARTRGDGIVAGEAFTRAAELSGEIANRWTRLVAAGSSFAAADANERALAAYDEALAIDSTPSQRADVHLLRIAPYIEARGPAGLHTELFTFISELESTDPKVAAMITATAAVPALASGEMRAARFLSRRALQHARGEGDSTTAAARVATLLNAIASTFAGDVTSHLAALHEYASHESVGPLDPNTAPFAPVVADVLTFTGQFSASSHLLTHVIARARERAEVGALILALAVRAELYFRTAHWPAALADAEESAGLARDARHPALLGYTLHAMTRVEAGLGKSDAAARHGGEGLEVATRYGLGSVVFGIRGALGFLALSEGRPSAAVAHLEHARRIAEREEILLLMANPWAPDLVEAYLRNGRPAEARALTGSLAADRVAEQGLLAEAIVSRCRGMVARGSYDELFEASLAAHTRARAPFELARTELCYGERLRRDRRLVHAVPHLGAATAGFRQIGATTWRARAAQELEAEDRETESTRGDPGPLTPQEFRIAAAVARGATNREAAASLFLSPRTVEYHLAKIYRKLGVRSRTELARYIGNEVGAGADVGDVARA